MGEEEADVEEVRGQEGSQPEEEVGVVIFFVLGFVGGGFGFAVGEGEEEVPEG